MQNNFNNSQLYAHCGRRLFAFPEIAAISARRSTGGDFFTCMSTAIKSELKWATADKR
jgi:hypothetical protein